MSDADTLSNVSRQLQSLREELIPVFVRAPTHGASADISCARRDLADAAQHLEQAAAAYSPAHDRFIGLDTRRHTRAGEGQQ